MPSKKIHAIENIRLFLVSLVVLHHLAIAYGGLRMWYYQETTAYPAVSTLLALFSAINQSFFMGLFFLIAAYFTPVSFDRKGPLSYSRDRLARLGVPLLIFYFILSPITRFMTLKFVRHASRSLWDYLHSLDGVGFGPLWFVEALLLFTAVYVTARLLFKRSAPPPPNKTNLPSDRVVFLTALIAGLLSALVRIFIPIGNIIGPFEFQPAHFVQYALLFTAGIIAARNQWLTAVGLKRGLAWGAASLLLIFVGAPVLLFFGGGASGNLTPFLGGMHWQSLTFSLWEQLLGFTVIMALLGIFGQRVNRQWPWLEKFSDSAYAVFVIHAPILVALSLSLRPVPVDPIWKLFLLTPVSLIVCFTAATLLRKIPGVDKVL